MPSSPVGGGGERLALPGGTPVWLRRPGFRRPRDEDEELTAVDAEQRVVGCATWRRVYGPRAVVSVTADEAYWHRGLPEVLLDRLCDRASLLGITTFLMHAPASDVRLLALVSDRFAAHWVRDGGVVDIEFSTAALPRRR